MNSIYKNHWFIFSVFGFLAVAFGAFGAHGLSGILTEPDMKIYRTAVEYQFYHCLALGIVLLLAERSPSVWLKRAMTLFVIGTVIFSGSLYLLVLTQMRSWGAVTPMGGICLLLGWGCLIIFTIKSPYNA